MVRVDRVAAKFLYSTAGEGHRAGLGNGLAGYGSSSL